MLFWIGLVVGIGLGTTATVRWHRSARSMDHADAAMATLHGSLDRALAADDHALTAPTSRALAQALEDLRTEAANVLGGDLDQGNNRLWLRRRVEDARALLDRMAPT